MDKKENSFMGLVGLSWVPNEEWKETAPLKIKFRFSVKVNIYLKPCICLESENVSIKNEDATGKIFWIFEILHLKIIKLENGWGMNWPPPTKYNSPLIGQPPPWNQKYFDLSQKPKITKFQLPLTLEGGAHNGRSCSISSQGLIFGWSKKWEQWINFLLLSNIIQNNYTSCTPIFYHFGDEAGHNFCGLKILL